MQRPVSRFESSVTSVSWIPSEAVEGLVSLPFELNIGHFDAPLPDHIDDLEALRRADAFRFANELRAFVEVQNGRITGYGHLGRGRLGSTTVRLGPKAVAFAATAFPEMRTALASSTSVIFVQTAGGRPGVPLPRRVRHAPYFQVTAPTVWTTLSLTMNADGSSRFQLTGASTFPRHWVYDHEMNVVAKSGTIDFHRWYERAFGSHTPWGDEECAPLVTTAETALERQLSASIMRGGRKPMIRRFDVGDLVVDQGQPGSDLYLLLDGVLSVEVDGTVVGEVGPGAVVGERALLEGGRRTATLRAVTSAKVAAASPDELDDEALAQLASGHRWEATR